MGRLVGWIEDNHENLRRKQIAWHKEVKEEAFADEDHITVKIISENNMKRIWKDASTFRVGNQA